ncbi:MAG: MFS transporter [Chthonomonadales bacterium]
MSIRPAEIWAGMRARVRALPKDTRRAWQWDMATGILAGLYQGAIWTFVMRVARADLHVSSAQMAWIAAAPAAGYLFATVWARQMEGRAKLPFVYWTWLAARGLFLLTPLVRTREQYVALVCITPLLFSVSTPAYTAIMKEIYADRHRGRLMSAVRVAMNTVTLVTALAVGRWMDRGLDFRWAFCAGGVFGALSAFTFSRIPVPNPAPARDTPVGTAAFVQETLGILVRNPGYRWFTASVFISGFGNLMATTLYPIYQVDRFHVSNTDVANLQNVTSVCTILGFFYWGGLLDRRGPLFTVAASVAINLTVPLLYALAGSLGWLYWGAAATGLCMSGIDIGYLNTILLFSEPGKAAQYQALHSSFFGIRGTIAPSCAIALRQAVGYHGAFLFSFAMMCAGLLVQVVSMRGVRQYPSSAAGCCDRGKAATGASQAP